jgi:hypothetical protein
MPPRELDVHVVLSELLERVSRELGLSGDSDGSEEFLVEPFAIVGKEVQSLAVGFAPFLSFALVVIQTSCQAALSSTSAMAHTLELERVDSPSRACRSSCSKSDPNRHGLGARRCPRESQGYRC